MDEIPVLDWFGLYGQGWREEITPEAYGHPAKFSRGLIRRIYQHAIDNEYLKPGDQVVDPFGGVALGALDAMRYGLTWTGCELEPRFHQMGQANIALWNARYGPHLPGWGTAQILQGDSRQLAQVLAQAGVVGGIVSSPPFSPPGNNPTGQGQGVRADYAAGKRTAATPETEYGTTAGQLGALPMTGLDGIVSSPPFVGVEPTRDDAFRYLDGRPLGSTGDHYGTADGQLGVMPEGIVSSPPYEGSAAGNQGTNQRKAGDPGFVFDSEPGDRYGDSEGQLGGEVAETFWAAAAQIVQQCYQVLAPGGYAIWVTKRFVRDKKIVEFSDQWLALCEHVGFVPVERVRAWVIEEAEAGQMDLFGGFHRDKKARLSFFRRLHMKKFPHLAIEYEDVLIVKKPETSNG